MSESAQDIYRTSSASVRASFGEDKVGALDFYSPLQKFVTRVCPPGNQAGSVRLLDVGCGCGWSTFTFANAGYDANGIDLNPAAFEPPPHDHCRLCPGSATEIPFPSESFDLVVCYQCLEHVPDPSRALDEMARVCRPGGVVAIVGPNLVSPTLGLGFVVKPSTWPSLRFWRRPGMPRHPYGNTVPESLAFCFFHTAQLLAKLVRRSPRFTMREPDVVPPFHADNDACYLCNPTDLISYFRGHGFRIVRRGKPGRPPLSYLFAGGTWVAARKGTTLSP
ncbi:MAG: class I SAM-dependent methyltransferase [Isosphaeraceae bacterium]